MPVKQFEVPLAADRFMAVELQTYRGAITGFVIRLMLEESGALFCVARYDTAHGQPHRDLVDRTGRLLQKDWLTGMSFPAAATYAIQDFHKHHEIYVQRFTQST